MVSPARVIIHRWVLLLVLIGAGVSACLLTARAAPRGRGTCFQLVDRMGSIDAPALRSDKFSTIPVSSSQISVATRRPLFGAGGASIGKRIALRIKGADQRIPESLPIEPKVIPAKDPPSLSTKPDPVDVDLYISAARMHETYGNIPSAEQAYSKALQLQPKHVEVAIGYGRMLDRQEKFADATRVYLQATQEHPNNAVVYNDLGLCFARQSRLNDSIVALSRAIQLQPENRLYRNNAATVLVEMNRLDDAYTHLAAVHGEGVSHYNLGVLLYERGQVQRARIHFARALEMDPTFAPAREMLDQMDQQRAVSARPADPSWIESVPPIRPSYTPGRWTNQRRPMASGAPAPEPSPAPSYQTQNSALRRPEFSEHDFASLPRHLPRNNRARHGHTLSIRLPTLTLGYAQPGVDAQPPVPQPYGGMRTYDNRPHLLPPIGG